MDAVGDVRDLPDLVGELVKQVGEHEQTGSESELAVHDEISAVAQEHDHVDLSQKAHCRLEQVELVEDLEFLIADSPVRGGELFDLLRFSSEAFDDRDSLHVFDQREHHPVDQFARFDVGRLYKP